MLLVLMPLSGCFINDNLLFNGLITAKWLWFYGASLISGLILTAHLILKKKPGNINAFEVLIGLSFILLIISYFLRLGKVRLDEYFLKIICGAILWFSISRMILNKKNILSFIIIYLTITFIVALHGLLQLYGVMESHHSLFRITGSFHNPGPFSGYVVSALPMALGMYLLTKMAKRNNSDNSRKKSSGFAQTQKDEALIETTRNEQINLRLWKNTKKLSKPIGKQVSWSPTNSTQSFYWPNCITILDKIKKQVK